MLNRKFGDVRVRTDVLRDIKIQATKENMFMGDFIEHIFNYYMIKKQKDEKN